MNLYTRIHCVQYASVYKKVCILCTAIDGATCIEFCVHNTHAHTVAIFVPFEWCIVSVFVWFGWSADKFDAILLAMRRFHRQFSQLKTVCPDAGVQDVKGANINIYVLEIAHNCKEFLHFEKARKKLLHDLLEMLWLSASSALIDY